MEDDCLALFGVGETSTGRLCPLSGAALEQGCRQTPGEGNKQGKRLRKHDMQKKRHRKIISWRKRGRLRRECKNLRK